MSVLRGKARFLFAVALGGVSILAFSCRGVGPSLGVEYVYPLEQEVALLNTAAYPEGSYRVAPGDTLRRVAVRLNVDIEMLAAANGLSPGSKLTAGDVLVVPRVAPRGDNPIPPGAGPAAAGKPAGPHPTPEVGLAEREKPLVGADGILRAIAAGTVTAVFRGYTSLGDVVIIESAEKRIVYSGSFEPVTAKGCTVNAVDIIAVRAKPESVKARIFTK
ncbi:MAG: LysM peptidoglycan-binding domain-containing protein [Planctomycetes bacterium]|nr:LysM peptidoglycan-binding domain-containing protein [Planctomycetota bacterium]